MPVEVLQLSKKEAPFALCPKCGKSFYPFLRGEVQSWWRNLFGLPYCCLICRACKEIVGYEKP